MRQIYPVTPFIRRNDTGSVGWEFDSDEDAQPRHGNARFSVSFPKDREDKYLCREYDGDFVAYQGEVLLKPNLTPQELTGVKEFWDAAWKVGLDNANSEPHWTQLPHEKRRWIFQRLDIRVAWLQMNDLRIVLDEGAYKRSFTESWEITQYAPTDKNGYSRLRDLHGATLACELACRLHITVTSRMFIVAGLRSEQSPFPESIQAADDKTGRLVLWNGIGYPPVADELSNSRLYRLYRRTGDGRKPNKPGDAKNRDLDWGTILDKDDTPDANQREAADRTRLVFWTPKKDKKELYSPTIYEYDVVIDHCPCNERPKRK